MSEGIWNLIDTRICHECSKEISVLYPHLWRYKRKVKFGRVYYFCSWSCLRAYEKKGETKVKLTSEQKQQAIEMAIAGASPISFIRDCGVNNPENCWWYIKKKLKENDPETAAKIPGFRQSHKEEPPKTAGEAMAGVVACVDKFFGQCEEMGLMKGDTISAEEVCPPIKAPAEGMKVTAPPLTWMEYKTTGISTAIGDWVFFKKQGYLDWTPLDGAGTVSMSLEEWKELMKIFPEVLKVLEVEL